MGFFSKMLGLGVAVGTGYAIARIADKITSDNPDGIKDYNEDGVVDYRDYATAVTNATKSVAQDAGTAVKSKVDDIKANPDKYKDGAVEAYETVKGKAADAVNAVKDKYAELKDKKSCDCCCDDFADTVDDAAEDIKSTVSDAADTVKDTAEDVKDAVTE